MARLLKSNKFLPTIFLALFLMAVTGTPVIARNDLRTVPQSDNSYTLFETLQVRPLALSADGKTLFALNTPDNRLEIFRVTSSGLQSTASIEVGLEPIALALRSNREVWVVNHLSDSVSIVTLDDGDAPHVVNTLLVGDEPRDIVFAGTKRNLAFITTAHRGKIRQMTLICS